MEEIFNNLKTFIDMPAYYIDQLVFFPEYIRHALKDTVYFIPILYVLYYLIEHLERFIMVNFHIFVKWLQKLGPIQAILFSVIPECGYSVIASIAYARKLISRGTLFAFYIVCCDEALPIFFMDLSQASVIIPLLLIKSLLAIVVAIIIDIIGFILVRHDKKATINAVNIDVDSKGCCHHTISSKENIPYWWMHPFTHTVNMFVFTFVFLSVIYWGIGCFGSSDALAQQLFINSQWQVVAVGLFGIIPNCFVSLFIALAYLKGLISFPALLAGLISVTGMGLAVLEQHNKKKEDNFVIKIILLCVAIGTGLFIFFYGDIFNNLLQFIGINLK